MSGGDSSALEKRNVAILLFPGVEVLDFAGPLEVLSSITAISGNPDVEAQRLFQVYTVAETRDVVRCNNPLSVVPDFSLQDCPKPHILLVPGGIGTRKAVRNKNLIEWIQLMDKQSEITCSVCTGSLLLAEVGILDGKRATTHASALQLFRTSYPNVSVVEQTRWIDLGHVVTSAGVSAGMDMAFHLVHRLYGEQIAQHTAKIIEYDLKPFM